MEMRDTIRDFIYENMAIFDDEVEFVDDDNIFELGFVDSMFALKLVTFIEKEYNFEVANDELSLSNFSSVNNIVNFLNSKMD